MQWISTSSGRAILLGMILSSPIAAQNTRLDVSKHLTAIPKSCVSLLPAAIEGTVDIPALVKEAICKGSGDKLIDYTYVVDSVKREKDKKGKVKEERITYEVFFPTLKGGARTRGVLVVTSRNQVPVPPDELEKERFRAAKGRSRIGDDADYIRFSAEINDVKVEPPKNHDKKLLYSACSSGGTTATKSSALRRFPYHAKS